MLHESEFDRSFAENREEGCQVGDVFHVSSFVMVLDVDVSMECLDGVGFRR